jgi:hypothetical protein
MVKPEMLLQFKCWFVTVKVESIYKKNLSVFTEKLLCQRTDTMHLIISKFDFNIQVHLRVRSNLS